MTGIPRWRVRGIGRTVGGVTRAAIIRLLGAVVLVSTTAVVSARLLDDARPDPLARRGRRWRAVDAFVRAHLAEHPERYSEDAPLEVWLPRAADLRRPARAPSWLVAHWRRDGLPVRRPDRGGLVVDLAPDPDAPGDLRAGGVYGVGPSSAEIDECILRRRPDGGFDVVDYRYVGQGCF